MVALIKPIQDLEDQLKAKMNEIVPMSQNIRKRIEDEKPEGWEQLAANLDNLDAVLAKMNGQIS